MSSHGELPFILTTCIPTIQLKVLTTLGQCNMSFRCHILMQFQHPVGSQPIRFLLVLIELVAEQYGNRIHPQYKMLCCTYP